MKLFKLLVFTLIVGVVAAPNAFATDNLRGERQLETIYFKNVADKTPVQVRASHILVKSEKQAKDIKSKIDNGASFEEMAKKYSACPSGANGGDLGYFDKNQMVPDFGKVAFSLPVGQVSDPVQTQFGWHLIKVIDKK